MAKKDRNVNPENPAEVNGVANAVETAPPPNDPAQDGSQPIPQPAPAKREKRAKDDSNRPFYLLCGEQTHSAALDILLVRPTIGQARKAMSDAAQVSNGRHRGIIILKAKVAK